MKYFCPDGQGPRRAKILLPVHLDLLNMKRTISLYRGVLCDFDLVAGVEMKGEESHDEWGLSAVFLLYASQRGSVGGVHFGIKRP